jgi:hypothetical protein
MSIDSLFLLEIRQFPIKDLLDRGFDGEPFLGDILEAIKTRVLQDLKYKARIEVTKGVFLYGTS